MKEKNVKIKSFKVFGLWGKENIHWRDIKPDVNILVGINGSGKTTLLNTMYDVYAKAISEKKGKSEFMSLQYNPDKLDKETKIIYLQSLDNYSARDYRKKTSALMQQLEYVVYQNKEGFSFFNYRMKMLDQPDKAKEIQERIDKFIQLVNKLFSETNKTLKIINGQLIFQDEKGTIELNLLSSGEKQLLLILTNVFLLEEKPAIVFLDEPEISLHVSWQYCLIDVLTKLDPAAQFIITTHSPSIFGKGWGSNVVYMEDITEKI